MSWKKPLPGACLVFSQDKLNIKGLPLFFYVILLKMVYVFLIGALVLNATANILLKTAAVVPAPSELSLWSLISTYRVGILGLVLFCLNVGLYFLALKSLPLSVAYPVMVGGGFLIVGMYAWFMLNEHITAPLIIGYILIFVGVLLITTTK